jgi:glycosyltransferase involved in cell wall biosynthesis
MTAILEAPRAKSERSTSDHDYFMKGLRLLIVADSSTTHTERWAKWYAQRGAKISVLSFAPDPIEGVNVVHFPTPRWYSKIPKVKVALDYLPFKRIIRELDPQLIHFHFVSEGGRWWYWNHVDVPMVASTWGQDVIFDTGPYPGAEKSLSKILDRANVVTASTHQLARETARYTPERKPIYVIPFGIDLTRFHVKPDVAGDPFVIGFVKWLLPKYGPDVAIEAFNIIHQKRPRTKLVLAGRGTMREQLEKRIAELGLQASVEILGRVTYDKVPALCQSFDLMIMPSIYESETFGVAAAEAAACAVPTVASRIGGIPEAIIHGKTGLLVPPRDPAALAEACIELIDDHQRRREMGLAGRRFVEKYYIWPVSTWKMEEIYRAVLEKDQPKGIPIYRAGVEPTFEIPEE